MSSELPEHIRRAIYGEVGPEEKREALASSHAAWKAERNKEPPVPGTTKGDFTNLGMIGAAIPELRAQQAGHAPTEEPTSTETQMGLRES